MVSTNSCNLMSLSQELLCHILNFLPLRDVLMIGTLNKNLSAAAKLHLRLLKEIDLCEDKVIGYLPDVINDWHLQVLLKKCPNLEVIHGLHTSKLERTRLRKSNGLSILGVLDAISACTKLKRIETSNYKLLEAVSHSSPQIELEGIFRNRDGVFPPQPNPLVKLSPFLRLTSLHLIGVQVTELTPMPELEDLHLQWVGFTRLHPFRSFSAVKLKSFVMKQCIGPAFPLRYYPLFIALGYAPGLSRLEIVRVPILGGMILRSAEEGLRNQGFMQLKKLLVCDCKGIMESDLGQLMIASSRTLETVIIQASLTKDSLVAALHFAGCQFPSVKTLHLGYEDRFPATEMFTNETLLNMGLAEVPDVPASLTDSGLKTVGQLFPNVENLTINNCPHMVNAKDWIPDGENNLWRHVKYLALDRCHCLRLVPFSSFLTKLLSLEVLLVVNMFREPPKGCSHVGLSAGTGLGLSSAIVSNQDEHIAVQGHNVEAGNDGVEMDLSDNEPEVIEVDRRRGGCLILEGRQQIGQNHAHPRAQPGCSGNQSLRVYTHRMSSAGRSTPGKSGSGRIYCNRNEYESISSTDSDYSSSSSSESSSNDNLSTHSSYSSEEVPSTEYVGPITRRRTQMLLAAKSRIPNSSGKGKMKRSSHVRQPVSSSVPTRKRKCRKSSSKSNRSKCNKATRDPFYEEDVTLVLPITCQSLISLTVINCGISDIRIENCPNLEFLEVQACRILKHIQVLDSPVVTKVKIIRCPKFHIPYLVTEMLNLYNENPLLVYIVPYLVNQPYSLSKMEELVFSNANSNHNVTLIHSDDKSGKSIPFQENLLNWLRFSASLLKAINPETLTKKGFMGFAQDCREPCTLKELIAAQDNPAKPVYPWGHKVHRIVGSSKVGSYELLTNNPIFASLWRERENSIEATWFQNPSDESSNLPSFLKYEVADMVELKSSIGKHHVGFYINVENGSFA